VFTTFIAVRTVAIVAVVLWWLFIVVAESEWYIACADYCNNFMWGGFVISAVALHRTLPIAACYSYGYIRTGCV